MWCVALLSELPSLSQCLGRPLAAVLAEAAQ